MVRLPPHRAVVITPVLMVILGDDLRKEAAIEKSAKQLIEEGEWADCWICLEVFRRQR